MSDGKLYRVVIRVKSDNAPVFAEGFDPGVLAIEEFTLDEDKVKDAADGMVSMFFLDKMEELLHDTVEAIIEVKANES